MLKDYLRMAGSIGGFYRQDMRRTYKTKTIGTRPCIVCGADHSGNNAFCSSKCCKSHKAVDTSKE